MPVTKEFVFKNRRILERHTCYLNIGEYLGSGCWGSVFETDNPKWVVKITKDIEEAKASSILIDLRGKGHEACLFLGLVDILWVSKVVDLEDDGEDLYVIVRENVTPLEETDTDDEIIDELSNNLYVIEEQDAYTKDEISKALTVVDRHAPHLARAIKEVWFYGYKLVDLDAVNVGITRRDRMGVPTGTIVMFDISFEEK
jgi:hypothetical protein